MNKKATWAWADALYWFFYLPLTLIVVVALIVVPNTILNSSVQPHALDSTIMNQRIETTLTNYYPTTGAYEKILVQNPQQALIYSLSPKKFGARIYIMDNSYYINKQYYDDAKPLVGLRYYGSIHQTTMNLENGAKFTMSTDQVYPPRYEQ